MRKLPLLLFVLLLLALVPQAQAWEWATHRRVVEAAYEELPENIRARLSRDWIREGSTWPDRYKYEPDPRYGQTYPGHFQPEARGHAAYWLARARGYYRNGDFEDASLALGIASHYIADACCLAHNPPHAYDWNLHAELESRAAGLWPERPEGIPNFDLQRVLVQIETDAPSKWKRWLQTRDTSILQEDLNDATSYTYNAWCQALDVAPRIAEKSIWPNLVVATALAVLAVSVAIGVKRYYRM